jgi:hypothetical protein
MSSDINKPSSSSAQSLLDSFKNSKFGQVILIAVFVAGITAPVVIGLYQPLLDNRNLKIEDLTQKTQKLEYLLQQRNSQIISLADSIKQLELNLQKKDAYIEELRKLRGNANIPPNRVKTVYGRENKNSVKVTSSERTGLLMIELPPSVYPVTVVVNDSSYGEMASIPMPYGKHRIKIVSGIGTVEREVVIQDTTLLPLSKYDFRK